MTEPTGTSDQACAPTGLAGGRRRITVIAGVCLALLVLGGGAAAFGHLGGSDQPDVGAAATQVPTRGASDGPSVEPDESAPASLETASAPAATVPSNAPAATRPTARATATPAAPKPRYT